MYFGREAVSLKRRVCRTVFVVLTLIIIVGVSIGFSIGQVGAAGSQDSLTLYDFSTNTGEWVRSDNVRAVEVGMYDFGSEDDPDLRSCLKAESHDLSVGLIRAIEADFASPLDLTEYRSFSYEIYALPYDADPFATYYTRVRLFSSDGSSVENIVEIKPNGWQEVSLDLSTWSQRSDVVSAEISLTISTTISQMNENSFYIDNVTVGDRIDRELTERFMFDVFEVEGGQAAFSEDRKLLRITLSQTEITSLKATVFVPETKWQTNAVRIKLSNKSSASQMTIHYSTYDTFALSEDKTVTVLLDAQSESEYYYIDVGDVSMLRYVDIQLESGSGYIEIESISAMNIYRPVSRTVAGSIDVCQLSDDLQSVHFTGTITRDEVLANQDGVIALYALSPTELLDMEKLASTEPLLTSPMTTKFDLSLDIGDRLSQIICAQFVAVSKHTDGTLVLIADPVYISNPERAAKYSAVVGGGPKGVVSPDASIVGETAADRTIVEVDAASLFGDKSTSEHYSYSGGNYYFNSETLDILNNKITAYNGSGIGVLLRIDNWYPELTSELDAKYASDGYVDYTEYNVSPDGKRYLEAFVAYAGERWCQDGGVGGIIWGTCLNFMDRSQPGYESLNDMIYEDATSLRIIYNTLRSKNSSAGVYISVSDIYSVELATESSEVGLDIYLTALANATSSQGGFNWGVCVDRFWRIGEDNGTTVDPNQLELLSKLLSDEGMYDVRFVYCDSTYSFPNLMLGDLMSQLMLGYYSACFNASLESYFVVLGTNDNTEYLMEYLTIADSVDSVEFSESALTLLGANDWSELIDNFDTRRLVKKSVASSQVDYEEPSGIKGRFDYYNFDSFSTLSGFEVSYYCKELLVPSQNDGILCALLDKGAYGDGSDGMYMGIAHRYDYPENLKLTPVLAVTLGVDDVDNTSLDTVRVKIVLFAENERFESYATLNVGELQTIYINLEDFNGAEDTTGIQILVDGSELDNATLMLKSVTGLSRDYNDESLESVIADERARKRSPDEGVSYRVYIWIGAAVIVAVASILTFLLLSRKKRQV